MSRTRRFLGGVSFGYANQILVTLVGLWLTPFLLGRIGQHDYGLWLVGAQVTAYLALLDFGVVALLPRETALAMGRIGNTGNREDLQVLIGQTARLALWQTPLVALVSATLWFSMPAAWEELRGPLLLVLLAFVLTFPLRIFQAVLQGLQDLTFLAKTQMCAWLVSVVITVTLVMAGLGLHALAVGWVAAQVLAIPIIWYRARRRFPDALPSCIPSLPWGTARGRIGRSFWVSLNQIAQVLLFSTDVLIIGRFLGPAAVVPYACTGKLVAVLANQPQMLMQAALPALSELRGGENREQLSKVCVALSQAMLLISGAVVCVVLATNRGFVSWWVGSEQFGGLLLTVLILLSMLLRHINATFIYMLFSFGFDRRLAITVLLDGLGTLCALVVFTWWLGLIGAPLGSVLSVCLIGLPANLLGLARVEAVSIRTLIMSLAPWFWRFIVLAIVSVIIALNWVPDTFTALAATGLSVATVYVAVMFPVALREPLGTYIRPRLSPLGGKFFRALRSISPA